MPAFLTLYCIAQSALLWYVTPRTKPLLMALRNVNAAGTVLLVVFATLSALGQP